MSLSQIKNQKSKIKNGTRLRTRAAYRRLVLPHATALCHGGGHAADVRARVSRGVRRERDDGVSAQARRVPHLAAAVRRGAAREPAARAADQSAEDRSARDRER